MHTLAKHGVGHRLRAGGYEGVVEQIVWSERYSCWGYRVTDAATGQPAMLYEAGCERVEVAAVSVKTPCVREEAAEPAAGPAPSGAREEAAEPAAEAAEEPKTTSFAYEAGPVKPLKWHRKGEHTYVAEGANGYWYVASIYSPKGQWILMKIHGSPTNTGIGIGRGDTFREMKGIAAAANQEEARGGSAPPPDAPAHPDPEVRAIASTCVPIVTLKRDGKRYEQCLKLAQKLGPIDSAKAVYRLLKKPLSEEDQEVFLVVGSDVRGQLRGIVEVARGQRSKVDTGITDMIRAVSAMGAERFIVVHNHPSGKASPSKADRDLTEAIKKAFKPLSDETVLADHVIVGVGEYYSVEENKLHKG